MQTLTGIQNEDLAVMVFTIPVFFHVEDHVFSFMSGYRFFAAILGSLFLYPDRGRN